MNIDRPNYQIKISVFAALLDETTQQPHSNSALSSVLGRITAAYQQAQAREWLAGVLKRYTATTVTERSVIFAVPDLFWKWKPSVTPYSSAYLARMNQILIERDIKIQALEKQKLTLPVADVWWDGIGVSVPKQRYYITEPRSRSGYLDSVRLSPDFKGWSIPVKGSNIMVPIIPGTGAPTVQSETVKSGRPCTEAEWKMCLEDPNYRRAFEEALRLGWKMAIKDPTIRRAYLDSIRKHRGSR